MDKTRGARMDLIDQCHKVWQCRSMEIELAEASAKLVEQQAEIESLRFQLNGVIKMRNEAENKIERLRAALRSLIGACHEGRIVSKGAGGMTIEAQTRNSVINGVSAWAVCEAEEALDALQEKQG